MATIGPQHHGTPPRRRQFGGSSHEACHATAMGAKPRPEERGQNWGGPDARAKHEAARPAEEVDGHDGEHH
eukprot:605704-Heterocapsa_arctica.AAC.1